MSDVFPPSNSDFAGFSRTCAGCGGKIAPTSQKHPRPHWFETARDGTLLSFHFECHPLMREKAAA